MRHIKDLFKNDDALAIPCGTIGSLLGVVGCCGCFPFNICCCGLPTIITTLCGIGTGAIIGFLTDTCGICTTILAAIGSAAVGSTSTPMVQAIRI